MPQMRPTMMQRCVECKQFKKFEKRQRDCNRGLALMSQRSGGEPQEAKLRCAAGRATEDFRLVARFLPVALQGRWHICCWCCSSWLRWQGKGKGTVAEQT